MRAWRSLDEWRAQAAGIRAAEDAIAVPEGVLAGCCALCGSPRGFAAQPPVDTREGLRCLACGCNARQRAVASALLGGAPAPEARVFLTEQASALFVALRRRLPRLEGSEFGTPWLRRLRMAAWLARRGVPAWIRQRDVTALDFADATLDAVASLDVLEHVPRHEAALSEFARVLRPGGVLLFTVPFYEDQPCGETIARVGPDGAVEFFGAPEYHGDPRGHGVPCFHHFGWDLLQMLRRSGFADAAMVRAWQPEHGLPRGIWLVRAVR
ncbi:class I SAM-dependent methyltransferase [Pseudoxanthomonas sp. 10H]|uniref:class I SAM-dependent methyltransferase n=1 Tax=Pseudoxanthomonas sp. 10H TaxID=3242729 RepID=UPI00355932CD